MSGDRDHGPARGPGPLERWTRRVLRVYSRGFRSLFGPEIAGYLQECVDAESSAWRRVVVAVRELGGLLLGAVRERLEGDGARWRRTGRGTERRQRRRGMVEGVIEDLGFARRALRRRPGAVLLAVTTLAVATGACLLLFSLADAVLLRSLPYGEPDRLVQIWNRYGEGTAHSAVPDYIDRRDRASSLEAIAALRIGSTAFEADRGQPRQAATAHVTRGFFELLAVPAALGHVAFPDEVGDDPGSVVVLSDRLWREQLGADPDVIGTTVRIDREPKLIQAILPPSFDLPRDVELFLPLVFAPGQLGDDNRGNEFLEVYGRMAVDATLESTRAELDTIAAGVIERVPERADFLQRAGWGAEVVPLRDELVGPVEPVFAVVAGAVLFLLLVACVNVANLFLALGAGRVAEMKVRACMGAGRVRLFRQLTLESLIVGVLGAAVGIGVAAAGLRLLPGWLAESLPRAEATAIDLRVIAVALALGVGTAMLFGLAPAWSGARSVDLGTRGGIGASARWRRLLVIGEVALASVLLAGSGLMLRGLERMTRLDPGFSVDQRVAFRVSLPREQYPGREERARFSERLLAELSSQPGVHHVGAADRLPLDGRRWTSTFYPEGYQPAAGEEPPGARLVAASEGYFHALGIELVAGRSFGVQERLDAPRAVVVDRTAALRYWPDGAVGERLTFAREPGPDDWRHIVGVVDTVRQHELVEQAAPTVYVATSQVPLRDLSVVVETSVPDVLIPAVAGIVASIDPQLPVFDVLPLEQVYRSQLRLPRFQVVVASMFAAIALLLVAIGIHGVLSVSVMERTREIGLRMAVGASRGGVVRLVLGEAAAMVAVGVLLGLAATTAITGWLGGRFYGVEAEPLVFAVVAMVGFGCALLVALRPARRAASVDPAVTLRA